MSVVTGVVLITSCCEKDGSTGCEGPPLWLEEINAWLLDQAGSNLSWHLRSVEQHFGGWKHPQTNVAGGGFNYFLEDDFAAYILSRTWEYPDEVVLIMHPEEGAARVFRPGDLPTSRPGEEAMATYQ